MLTIRTFESILISGSPKSGKSALTDKLLPILNAQFPEYQWKKSSVGNIWREIYEKLHPQHEITFEEYWRNTTLQENRQMNIKSKALFEKGGIVADLRFTAHFDPKKCLRIFLTADLMTRATRAQSSYSGKSIEEIINILALREGDELRMSREMFGKDYDFRDKKYHHALIDTTSVSVDREAEIVMALMKGDMPPSKVETVGLTELPS